MEAPSDFVYLLKAFRCLQKNVRLQRNKRMIEEFLLENLTKAITFNEESLIFRGFLALVQNRQRKAKDRLNYSLL